MNERTRKALEERLIQERVQLKYESGRLGDLRTLVKDQEEVVRGIEMTIGQIEEDISRA